MELVVYKIILLRIQNKRKIAKTVLQGTVEKMLQKIISLKNKIARTQVV